MEKNIKTFIGRYHKLKEFINSITETLEGYLDETAGLSSKFDEFLGSYTYKVSAVVYGCYDDDRKKIDNLLKEMIELTNEKGFKEFKKYLNYLKL